MRFIDNPNRPSPAVLSDLKQAYNRIKNTPSGGPICKQLEDSPIEFGITQTPGLQSSYDPLTHLINIDTNLPPSSDPIDAQLGHELGHASGIPGEPQVIDQVENPIRRELGEPPRVLP